MPSINTLRDAAITNSGSSTSTTAWRTAHLAWWQNYWTNSYAVLNDTVAMQYYYGVLYNMGTSYRAGSAPPGLGGLWIFSDDAAFSNSYGCNRHYAPLHATQATQLILRQGSKKRLWTENWLQGKNMALSKQCPNRGAEK